MTPEPTQHQPSDLSTHKPAKQASIHPRKTGFGQTYAYKEAVCLVVELYFVILSALYVIQCHMSLDGRAATCTRTYSKVTE